MFRLVVLVVASFAAVQGACRYGCYKPVKHYEDLGCKGIYEFPACCPHYYNCTDFFDQANDKCYFQGNTYNLQDNIPEDITRKYCTAECLCSKTDSEDVTCAQIECPELSNPTPLDPGCFYTYDVDGCCSRETVCPPFENLATCLVEGTTYYEGQRFTPPGWEKQLNCVCQPNFEGGYVEPFCKSINCGTELRDAANARKKCAPVFYGELPCPQSWECPQQGDNVVPTKSSRQSGHKCYYGEQELNVGDQLVLDRYGASTSFSCECSIPPLVTCIKKY